jgi:putative spermidine/putrescine transport system ATP-binding protein
VDRVAYLSLQNVSKSYDGKIRAVDGIDLDIRRGEFVTFLGPSGSGKTTTLMMIAGFEDPDDGTIVLDGKNLAHTKPYDRNIGMVFQNYALFSHMTVARNVGFPLRMRRTRKEEVKRRVDEALKLVGLADCSERHPRELSGGQQQRVAVARGLVFNPDVLLLDEPLGALDKNLREQMQLELKRIHRDVGITMVYVTHDQSEAMTLSDRVAVFRSGRIEQVGPPLEIYNHPRSRFVGEFIGDSNFFRGRLLADRPGWVDLDGLGLTRLPSQAASVSPSTGDIALLVRPERLFPAPSAGDESVNTLQMRIETIVDYGESIVVVGRTGDLPIRMRLAGTSRADLCEGITITAGWFASDAHSVPWEARGPI